MLPLPQLLAFQAAPFRRISIGREVRGKRSRCNDAKAVVRYNWRQVIESGLDEELTFSN